VYLCVDGIPHREHGAKHPNPPSHLESLCHMATASTVHMDSSKIRTLRGQTTYEGWKVDVLGFATIRGIKGHLDGMAKEPPRPQVVAIAGSSSMDFQIWRDDVK
jgi:hypothetical protein